MDDDIGQITAVHGGEAISDDRQVSGPHGDHTEVTTTMQRNTRRIIAAVAVIALLAAGGAAFTAAIGGLDGSTTAIGFGSETVAGATATGVHYTLDSNGQYVDTVTVTLAGGSGDIDYSTGYSFKGSLMSDTSGTVEQTGVCAPGSYDAVNNDTVVTCDFTGFTSAGGTAAGSGLANTGTPVDAVQGFDLSVTGANGGNNTTETLG
jgi:hypothetical protein